MNIWEPRAFSIPLSRALTPSSFTIYAMRYEGRHESLQGSQRARLSVRARAHCVERPGALRMDVPDATVRALCARASGW